MSGHAIAIVIDLCVCVCVCVNDCVCVCVWLLWCDFCVDQLRLLRRLAVVLLVPPHRPRRRVVKAIGIARHAKDTTMHRGQSASSARQRNLNNRPIPSQLFLLLFRCGASQSTSGRFGVSSSLSR
jgi:hypothetical protein